MSDFVFTDNGMSEYSANKEHLRKGILIGEAGNKDHFIGMRVGGSILLREYYRALDITSWKG
jgi:hypothetical protein